ncbi:hypothetical protein J4E90_000044 [Alternaria incomplexa]|uniref:uncharacterized protein n=1 Tax=Alternaria incomplexa TaxID=1187928 RepID=UPI00221FB4BA|nr:uncharacterized protein J4E90_000044 [Alternaria incomplexa]KAI4921618.1 hypothetical protein J4E90_000044 [Alternaria incomplexa]
MANKAKYKTFLKRKNRKGGSNIEDAESKKNNQKRHPNHFGKPEPEVRSAYNPDRDPFKDDYIDNTCAKGNHFRFYTNDGECYYSVAIINSSTETAPEAEPESEIQMLKTLYSASRKAGKELAKGRFLSLEQPPWRTFLPPRKPEHDYGLTPEGRSLHGRLSPWLYLCDHTCDLGLCDITFRLPSACPLGATCRWKHEIDWDDLSFLITSGRLSVRRTRTMLANWKSSATPSEDVGTWYRMHAIIRRLQYLEKPARIGYIYPYLFPGSDSHALFERLIDG